MPEMYCCRREMRCTRNGVALVFENNGQPWYVKHADEYRCRTCDRSVIAGVAPEPIADLSRDGLETCSTHVEKLKDGRLTDLIGRPQPVVIIPIT